MEQLRKSMGSIAKVLLVTGLTYVSGLLWAPCNLLAGCMDTDPCSHVMVLGQKRQTAHLLLFITVVEDSTAVLCANISSLPIFGRGIMPLEEAFAQRLI